MVTQYYNMSFTTGGIFLRESVELAELYLVLGDWQAVRSKALADNLIQARTASSAIRVCRESCQRLEGLHDPELQILAKGSLQEQEQILWVAICRRHRFVKEFAVDVIREKFLRLDLHLRPEDYNAFFNAKAEWHDELEHLTESTRNKLRQVVFKILRESGLLTKKSIINPVTLTPQVARTVGGQSSDDLRIFPLSDRDIWELLK